MLVLSASKPAVGTLCTPARPQPRPRNGQRVVAGMTGMAPNARRQTTIMARICVIRQFYFPLDIRVRREVEALVAAGHQVDVICQARPDEPRFERQGPITIRRVPLHHRRGSALRYMFEYASFLAVATVLAGALHLRRRYDLIQVNSIPDTLVFAALVPRLLGARVLLDLHECMPEFYATKFKTGLEHQGVRLIARLEQASIRFADFAITCTAQMREAFVGRGAPPEKIEVILNSADEAIFDAERFPPQPCRSGEFTLICHGSIEERYGLDTVIKAVALLKGVIPGLRLRIFGEGSYRDELQQLTRRLGVEREVSFSDGFRPMDELLQAIAGADAGVVAMKRDAFRDLTHCNKMFEYITMRKPAIVSRPRSVEASFDASSFQLFASDDEHDLARAIRELYDDPQLGDQLVRRAAQVNEAYRWPHQRERYQRTVEGLLAAAKGSIARDVAAYGALVRDDEAARPSLTGGR
jgi:glycosyltransferase involved in cell wall biosynthesis